MTNIDHDRANRDLADPEPQAPEPPLPGDCCGDGCARCVNDVYADALERYQQRLAQWQQRQLLD